jgi:neurotransmitter:Na+ symporter, NSS family
MERWSSRIGFLLAAIGSAVGIGNIWRFSSVVGQNGGGAYLIPYLIAVFLFAVPLMILELAMGREFRGHVVSAFEQVRGRFHILGWLVCAIVFLILSYYLVITGWTLAFFLFSVTGSQITFQEFTATPLPILFFIITALICGSIVSLGVRGGIERITTVLMPLVFLILIAMAIFAFTLPGFTEAISFLFTPDFSVLANPVIWSAAFGQAFFSLSVGQGILLTYGVYLQKETNIPNSAVLITLADLSVALLGGIVIFPIVFTFGLEPAVGAELAFSTLPRAFGLLPYGQVLAIAFFLLLFVAALTSAISMLEVAMAAVTGTTGVPRKKISAILTGLVILIGLPSAISYSSLSLNLFGTRILDLMDETVGTLGLPITALITAVIFTWFLDRDVLDSQTGGKNGIMRLIFPAVKYMIPAVLVVVTLSKILLGYDLPGWGRMPGVPFIGGLAQSLGTVLIVVALLGIISLFCYRRRCYRGVPQLVRAYLEKIRW